MFGGWLLEENVALACERVHKKKAAVPRLHTKGLMLCFTSHCKFPLPRSQESQVYAKWLFVQEQFSFKFWQMAYVKMVVSSSTTALEMGFTLVNIKLPCFLQMRHSSVNKQR